MLRTKADILQLIEKLPELGEQDVNNLLSSLCPSIKAREISLLEVVEALGTSLTNTNPSHRGMGTRFLADTLHALPRDKLSEEETSFLTAFFVDRFKDHHSVTPHVIYAVMALVEQEKIQKKDIVSLLQSLFREVHCQSQIMTDRRNVYILFKYCLLNKIDAIRDMGNDFVLGFITAMDGEKDPRNLVLLFAIFPTLVTSLPLGPFTEELFEVVAAYFPIDFVPPADDPFGISSEDLVLGLRRALSSTAAFAPFSIPLIQEKLDSDLTSAKLDALLTLVDCFDIYTSEDVRPHVSPLWVSIRREVIEGVSSEMENAALLALTSLVKALERGSVSQAARDANHLLINSALMECMGHLTAPEQRLMYPCAYLLIALMRSGHTSARLVSEKVIPLLALQFLNKTEDAARKNTIIILAKFMEEGSKFPELTEGVLKKLEDESWKAFSQGLLTSSSTVQEATIDGLTRTVSVFNADHLSKAASTMTSLLIDVNSNSLRDSIIKCFVVLSQTQPATVSDYILPLLLSNLEQGDSNNSDVTCAQILGTICVLTSGQLLLRKVLPVLWKRAKEILTISVDQACLYLSSIQKILISTIQDSECQRYVVEDWKGLTNVINMLLSVILDEEIENSFLVLRCLSGISRVIFGCLKDSTPVINSMIRLCLRKESSCSLSNEIISANPRFAEMFSESSTTSRESLLVYMYEGTLLGAQRNVELEECMAVLERLWDLSLTATEPEVRETAAVLLSSLINKMPLNYSFTHVLSRSDEQVTENLKTFKSLERREAALQMLTWICKALVMRGAQEGKLWTEKLLNLLCDPDIGQKAAQSFEVILKDHEYALQPQTFANIRLLYKQRYFESVIGPLIDTFDNTAGNTKQNALLAISSLLPHLPNLVLNAHIERLLPVLLHGVTSGNSAVMETTLSTLATLLKHSANHAVPHMSTLIPNLLKITSNQPLGIRLKSLNCLLALSSLPIAATRLYTVTVTRELKPVLNDKKRVVRQAAVNARSMWLLVGSPSKS